MKKQIEEMANYYCEYCKKQTGEKFCEHIDDKSCNIFFEAELFYNAGYRKVPKNAVVLTDIDLADRTYEIRKRAQEETRKETAIDFYSEMYDFAYRTKSYYTDALNDIIAKIDETFNDFRVELESLLREYGVEVEE